MLRALVLAVILALILWPLVFMAGPQPEPNRVAPLRMPWSPRP